MSEVKRERKEIISPEGVEELVEHELGLRVTLTGGGKYRVYMIKSGEDGPHTIGVYDKLEDAMRVAHDSLLIGCALFTNPEKTIKLLLSRDKT